ncbi:Alpha-monoglucosyldiacylglycerol synthase [BD1-7 clade bacterium]|uniref:Alpha-monoglucosyldiacylglycerol synthase n=1 Tax=BD1-7 clade bacterium TaxID=2029982 RepID=A0A5S9QM01_9GAMM|nr:Alpha-monoglucosyldiacylglycerol synthase [BD1-7 clade bacterium]
MKHKIAIVLDAWDYSFNGTAVSTKRFIQQLEKQGYEFVILATGKEMPGKVRFREFGVPGLKWILHKMKSPLALADKALLREALKDVDLLHVQYPFLLGSAAITVAKELGIPVVCSFHVQPENVTKNLKLNTEASISFLYRVFIKYFYSRADVVICPSPFAENMLKEQGLKTETRVISNGVPEEFLIPPRAEDFIPRKPFNLLSVGRLASEKHQDLIMKAVSQSKFIDQINMTFVGTGPAEGRLRRFAEKTLTCPYRISEVSDEELKRLYNSADLFIHAGEIELEGMSVLEAMANSIPTIVSDSKDSAAKDFAVTENSLFNFPHVDDLTRKIDYWLANPKARAEVALQNHQKACRYTHKYSCRALENIYREQLKLAVHEDFSDLVYEPEAECISAKS